ncbi:MAG TPA: hypothetical protein VKW76_10770 [Candidatus Binatia bacterium]|nr:hypothetical protein [Candidatus Binatia bacterium]
MADDELLRLSARELLLYQDLAHGYEALLGVLRDDPSPGAAPELREATARTERATDALRAVSAALAPWRLAGRPVPESVRSVWRASAEVAAQAVEANAALVAHARAHQAALAKRLAVLDTGRRALAGYARAAGRSAA